MNDTKILPIALTILLPRSNRSDEITKEEADETHARDYRAGSANSVSSV